MTPAFFPTLGTNAAAGTLFTQEHTKPGHDTDIVISHAGRVRWEEILQYSAVR